MKSKGKIAAGNNAVGTGITPMGKTFATIPDVVVTNRPIREARQSLVDVPAYTIPEAAAFLAIPRRTMYVWFSGRQRLFTPSGHVGKCGLLSFRDVAQAYMLYVLREFHRVPTSRIREALLELRKESKNTHPLLSLDIKVLGTRLLLDKPARGRHGREIVDLSSSRNLALGPVVDAWGKRIIQSSNRQPVQLFPWRFFTSDESRPVTLDPAVMSGQLVVTGTRIPVNVLLGMKSRGKEPEEIAEMYRLSPGVVEKALLHIEHPLPKVA